MDMEELAAQLAAALPGTQLPHVGDRTPGWTPERSGCHENARRWVEANPAFVIVHGWLNAKGETFENRLRFVSHSVVRSPDGELMDITLGTGDPRYAFILHPLDDAHFREWIIGRVATVDHCIGPDPDLPPGWDRVDPSSDQSFL